MGIQHQVRPKYGSKNEEIVAKLREDAGAGPPVDPYMKVKRLTAEVAVAMALIHGGNWRVEIDHHAGFVLVSPRLADE